MRNSILQNVGTKFRLTCSIQQGSLPVHFKWFKNGVLLGEKNSNTKMEFGDDFSHLVIHRVDVDDSGNYSCHVSNSFGHDRQIVLLSVRGLRQLVYLGFLFSLLFCFTVTIDLIDSICFVFQFRHHGLLNQKTYTLTKMRDQKSNAELMARQSQR